ncbi:MAG: secondary thiamine-phosphate synthase enzyme YjbQ [Thermovenabulum sp.]|uniref:secondary thiamine-phosphate synthase enzyme YjbQ n=1 Tax=Thermovenabulum sp. TaxID=3100335 RepID=UPI003C7B1518
MKIISVETTERTQMVDITYEVRKGISELGVKDGLCLVFVPHTTAGITINENADQDVKTDIINSLNKLIPQKGDYRHREGNSDAHIKASLMGSSVMLAIENGELVLGSWQGIFFCEFDGPRKRKVVIKCIRNT